MTNKPLTIEVLEEFGQCDLTTLAAHIGRDESVVDAMLANYIRKGIVESVNGMYSLTEQTAPNSMNAKEITPNQAAPKAQSKVEVLRRLLSERGEMSSTELAKKAGFPVNNIGGLLGKDIEKGVIGMHKKDGRRFYYWAASVRLPVRHVELIKPEIEVGVSEPQPMKPVIESSDFITVPSSSALKRELQQLDQRLDVLQSERQQKASILDLIYELEDLLSVKAVNHDQ
ncbi:conserved hypothetical protein [Xenorhabdus bovienii str. puntauvense]|uniref:Transcriptional regulator HTH-type FeoC domain-containing protein n=1 Tax=Xenorhabdus bovienii str. puntauvense TaxID=1398201 RepID=A0A077NJ74_XENBV|nr:FeoC-like transcriptional regulator [Xenorhabdus bovienii]CDG98834.1 conserved hypothetical protein [Xenorhabdus bovienii str. puntauvense]